MSNVQGDKVKKWSYDIGEGNSDVGGVDRHEGEARKEMISPECDITPLLGSKLPQLRPVTLPSL